METLSTYKLSKTHKKHYIVKNINLHVNSGEIVGLLGPNGSGKTTTFHMILGLISQDTGKIFLNNINIGLLPTYSRSKLGIGYLPQDNSIFRKLTVFENLMSIAQIQYYLNDTERHEHVIKLMNEFHIYHLKNNIGQNLSGGERKRVEIARSLVARPKFILLDEPFAGVDPLSIKEIQQIIKKLQHHNNLGILITDHNVHATLHICDRVYIINQGLHIAHGSPQEILNHKHAQKIYLGSK